MPSQHEKESANIVVLDSSSDEEDGVQVKKRNTSASSPAAPPSQSRPQVTPSGSGYRTLDSQSFWKAGAYEEIRLSRADPAEGQLEHARVHPKFLHSNATSHKWAFGAIAELLDNAVDEISNGASFVKVDRIYNTRDNSPALLFQDDGGGMNPESLRKCMSLGYSSKKSNTTIGQYGNGFKTSTMRLGADVIVFSRASCSSQATQSVGLLSYTFLRKTGQDDVIVPMVDFDVSNHWAEPIIYGSQDDWSSNLKTILEWSPFSSKDHLLQQFEDIGSHGTKIIIYNLWLNDEGVYELNFDDEDEEDIRLRDEGSRGSKANKRTIEMQSHISYQIRFSLRAYASMLYLRKFKNFQIILRGKPVEQFNIADELKYPKSITYRPQLATTSKEASVETTLGFIKEAPGILICGFNVYHKNRLIRPFWKVTADGNSQGFGVVGVLEANFIEPAHDKQDFERSSLFYKLEMKLKQMQLEYWKSHCELIGHRPLVKNTSMRTMQKEFLVYPPPVELNANVRKHNPTGSHVVGLSANVQNKNLNGPIIGRVANPRQELSGSHLGKSRGTSSCVEMATLRPSTGHATESVQEVVVVDCSRSESIDQICEENIQLFLRCEEHTEKERELKRTVEKLEKEVEETRKKCAQLSAYLEIQRKEKIVKQSAKA